MFSNLLTHARHINSPTRNRHNLFTPSLLALSIGSLLSTGVTAQTLNLSSPDKQIVLSLSDDTGRPEYQIHFHGKSIIEPSRLGLVFASLGELGQGGMLGGSEKATQVTLITGSQSAAARKEALAMAANGSASSAGRLPSP